MLKNRELRKDESGRTHFRKETLRVVATDVKKKGAVVLKPGCGSLLRF